MLEEEKRKADQNLVLIILDLCHLNIPMQRTSIMTCDVNYSGFLVAAPIGFLGVPELLQIIDQADKWSDLALNE